MVRNRCRRVFRESFRLARPELPDFDLILIPMGPPRPEICMPACRDELVQLAQKAARKWERRQQPRK